MIEYLKEENRVYREQLGGKWPRFSYWSFRGSKAIRMGKWKCLRSHRSLYLYDLSTDIGETTDVAKKNPEVMKRMKGILKNPSRK